MYDERLKYRSLFAARNVIEFGRELDLRVVFTDLRKTADALAAARRMARDLRARITVMVAQIVPYPLALTAPDVPVDFTERLLEPAAAGDVHIEIYLCRDRNETIRRAVSPDSLVVVGVRPRLWWRSRWDCSLIRMLRRDGLRVITV